MITLTMIVIMILRSTSIIVIMILRSTYLIGITMIIKLAKSESRRQQLPCNNTCVQHGADGGGGGVWGVDVMRVRCGGSAGLDAGKDQEAAELCAIKELQQLQCALPLAHRHIHLHMRMHACMHVLVRACEHASMCACM